MLMLQLVTLKHKGNSISKQLVRSFTSTMATADATSTIPTMDLRSFHDHLSRSTRILALLGAGLSASSGLPTFRGAGGLWRTHNATDLATPEAFQADPGFVWQFYSYRRHMALNAKPNRAHMALAALSRHRPGFLTISQNVDGLSPRAGHPSQQLKLIHGNLFDVKCFNNHCNYSEPNNLADPIFPAVALPQSGEDSTTSTATGTGSCVVNTNPLIRGVDIANEEHKISHIPISTIPKCPECKTGLVRPGVVWFGESLPLDTVADINRFITSSHKIDLMLVIGTSSQVYPAAGYTKIAERKGARIAVVNPDTDSGDGLRPGIDWHFRGDAATIVPELFRPVIGETEDFVEGKNYGVVAPVMSNNNLASI